MLIGQKLYFLRQNRGLTQAELAEIAGVTNVAISLWESGRNIPRTESIRKICDYFGIDMQKFSDQDSDVYDSDLPGNMFPIHGTIQIPLLGDLSAGKGVIANLENEYVFAPDWVHADVAFRCKGDSMIGARIYDGDIVYIRRQDIVENGEIAAVEIGEEAVLKRVFFVGGNIILQPENAAYQPIIVSKSDIDKVLVWKLDRLSRSQLDTLYLMDTLQNKCSSCSKPLPQTGKPGLRIYKP